MMKKYDLAICMPYYERRKRLEETLLSFMKCGYFCGGRPTCTVSICDDGSIAEKAYKVPYLKTIPNKVSSLPEKDGWMNPCLPMNIAVRQTRSPLLLLQSPETYHPLPVAGSMVDLMDSAKDVVLCPTRCIGQPRMPWYAHPEHRPVKYWFCQMMTREFFEEVGGFDERYRNGQGYDDNDFAATLTRAGAVWKWAIGCEVVHVKVKRRDRLPPIQENRSLYRKKHG